MKDDLHFSVNVRQPQCLFKYKTTSVSYWVKLAQLALTSPELGTAQPQIVLIYCGLFLNAILVQNQIWLSMAYANLFRPMLIQIQISTSPVCIQFVNISYIGPCQWDIELEGFIMSVGRYFNIVNISRDNTYVSPWHRHWVMKLQ